MRLIMKTDGDAWAKATSDVERGMAHGMTATVRKTAAAVRDGVRQSISAAGFGSHWVNSIKSLMLTKGDVLNPSAWVHSTINFSDVFETGKHITGNPLLWLPLPAVPRWPGDATRQMSPKKYIQTVGPLVTIRRPGKTPLLGAIVETPSSPRTGGRHLTRSAFRRSASSRTTRVMVPLFVGIPAVEIEKRFDFAGAISRAEQGEDKLLQDEIKAATNGNQDIRSA